MSGARILFVEDEPGLALTVGDKLRASGFDFEHVGAGERALELIKRGGGYDMILLDIMLPGIDGFTVCRSLRRQGVSLPILMLSARGEIHDRIMGLRLGADDYLTKPFDPNELVARIEALLRRSRQAPEEMARPGFGEVQIDTLGMRVLRSGKEVELSPMEYQLLLYLVQNKGRVVSRETILREVWGFAKAPQTRTVDVHITWLRSKFELDRSNPRYIRTVRGAGYRFEA